MVHTVNGSWRKGIAYDLHTLSSRYLGVNDAGHDQWDNTRSEMGELVYRLKYAGDQSTIPSIVDLLKQIGGIETFDYLIPAPSSKKRAVQPVDLITEALGAQRGVSVLKGFLTKAEGAVEQKGIDDPAERQKSLAQNIIMSKAPSIVDKNVLIVDDLFRSGATLEACTKVLMTTGRAKSVCVLTMTKTRTRA